MDSTMLYRALAQRRPMSIHCTKRIRLSNFNPYQTFATTTDPGPRDTDIPPPDLSILTDERPKTKLETLRIIPASRSYFSSTPQFTDDALELESLLRNTTLLPTMSPDAAPKTIWKSIQEYQSSTVRENVRVSQYQGRVVKTLARLNLIHRSLMPREVETVLQRYMRDVQPSHNLQKPVVLDRWGRARAVGRRKASTAVAFLVEGEGKVLINGKSMTEVFGRVHDRESVIWPLKASQRTGKYNIWAFAKGGGCTGQAEALMLGVAKALLIHEPALKPVLRRAGCVTRDMRRVERKKPGRVKARKMPTWVKR